MRAGDWVVPVLLLGALFAGLWRGVSVYDAFLSGARDGLRTAWQVLPCLAAVLLAVALLSASGALDALQGALGRPFSRLGIPEEALPVMLLRPVSGSATLAMLEKTLARCGADSDAGRVASVLAGSSETILYTCSLYLASVGIRRARYALPVALLAWLAGSLAAGWACRITA